MLSLLPVRTSRADIKVGSISRSPSISHVGAPGLALVRGKPIPALSVLESLWTNAQGWALPGQKDGFRKVAWSCRSQWQWKACWPGAPGRGCLIPETSLQEESAPLSLPLGAVPCWQGICCGYSPSKKPPRAEDREASPEASQRPSFWANVFPFCLSQFTLGAKTSEVIHLISILFLVIH